LSLPRWKEIIGYLGEKQFSVLGKSFIFVKALRAMYCSTCGNSVPTDASFCSSCGSQTHSSLVTKSKGPEVTVLNEPVEKQDNRKYTYIAIAALILWFIAINPVNGNIFNTTHLDLAQNDCSFEFDDDDSFDDFFNELDEEITADCKKQKSESMAIMLLGIMGIIYCYFAINGPAKDDSDMESQLGQTSRDLEEQTAVRVEAEARALEAGQQRDAAMAELAAKTTAVAVLEAEKDIREANLNDANWLEEEISRLGRIVTITNYFSIGVLLILCFSLFSDAGISFEQNPANFEDSAGASDTIILELIINPKGCYESIVDPNLPMSNFESQLYTSLITQCDDARAEEIPLVFSMLLLLAISGGTSLKHGRVISEYIKLIEEIGDSPR